jgi:hypothetical protein
MPGGQAVLGISWQVAAAVIAILSQATKVGG